jgi:4-hydroxy-4-methyl-2-oxoglutarate aldolase
VKFAPLNMTPEEITDYTYEWTGARFPDGRPWVADDLLQRVARVTLTQAWGVLRNEGYHWQYEDGFVCTHPGGTLVGRALTAMTMPRRPGMRALMERKGAEAGCIGDQISRTSAFAWPIDMLAPGDVYVADVFGKHEQGPIMGDNLSTAIFAKSGRRRLRRVVHDASVRDIEGIREIEADFSSWLEDHIDELPVSKEAIQELLEERTW